MTLVVDLAPRQSGHADRPPRSFRPPMTTQAEPFVHMAAGVRVDTDALAARGLHASAAGVRGG